MKTKTNKIHAPGSIKATEHFQDVISRLEHCVPDLMPMAFAGYRYIAPFYAYFKGFLSAKKKADKEHYIEGMKQVCHAVDVLLARGNMRIDYNLNKGKFGWAWYTKEDKEVKE